MREFSQSFKKDLVRKPYSIKFLIMSKWLQISKTVMFFLKKYVFLNRFFKRNQKIISICFHHVCFFRVPYTLFGLKVLYREGECTALFLVVKGIHKRTHKLNPINLKKKSKTSQNATLKQKADKNFFYN